MNFHIARKEFFEGVGVVSGWGAGVSEFLL